MSVDFDTELLSLGRAEADQLGAVRTVRNILRLRRQRTSNEQCHRALSTDHVRVGVHNDAVADADENTAGDADGKLHPAQMSAPVGRAQVQPVRRRRKDSDRPDRSIPTCAVASVSK